MLAHGNVIALAAPPKVEIAVRDPVGRPPNYLEGRSLHLECIIVLYGEPPVKSVRWSKDGVASGKAQGRSIRYEWQKVNLQPLQGWQVAKISVFAICCRVHQWVLQTIAILEGLV